MLKNGSKGYFLDEKLNVLIEILTFQAKIKIIRLYGKLKIFLQNLNVLSKNKT